LLVAHFTPSENEWEPLVDTEGEGCHNPSIVEWGEVDDRRIFMMAPCTDGSYYVYRSYTSLKAWRDGAPISRVWGNSRDRKGEGVRSGFITATIDGKKVMLLTTPVYSEEKGKGQLHLWMTDNVRVHDVGPVSSETDDAAASSLLYRADQKELILLYEKKSGDSYSLVAVSLTEQLEQIKSVVKAWKDMDTALKSCASTGTVDPRIKNVCKGPIPTEGLVGFWSNSLEGNLWKDEYLGVNATVHGGNVAGTEGGVRFRGAAAGAEWPVGKLGQNQPYYFVNNEFALVATVMINAVPKEASTPLMGARMNDNAGTALFELSYTNNGKWRFKLGNAEAGEDDDDAKWEPNKTYQVVVEMKINEWYVHVDGNNIYDYEEDDDDTVSDGVERLFKSHRISHFYFGGDNVAVGTTTSHDVTVSSVLLYNRLLISSEVPQLNANKVALPTPAAEEPKPEEEDSPGTSDDGGNTDSETPSNGDLNQENPPNTGLNVADMNNGGDASSQAPEISPPHPAPQPSTTEQKQSQEEDDDISAGEDERPLPSKEEDEVDDRAIDDAELYFDGETPEGVVDEEELEKEGLRGDVESESPSPSLSKVSAGADGPGDGKADATENVPSQHEPDGNHVQQSSQPQVENEEVPSVNPKTSVRSKHSISKRRPLLQVRRWPQAAALLQTVMLGITLRCLRSPHNHRRRRVVRTTEKLRRSKQTITQQVPLYQALAPQQAELQTPVRSTRLAPKRRPLHLKRRRPQAAALLQTVTPGRLPRRTQATFLRLAQLGCLMETIRRHRREPTTPRLIKLLHPNLRRFPRHATRHRFLATSPLPSRTLLA
ncbi:trans-sialidase, partial [Trypanosoma rangeli]